MHETFSCTMKEIEINREKHFLTEGVLLDDFLHILVYMSQKFIMKNVLFYCMSLRDILSDVKSNIMKQFTSYT